MDNHTEIISRLPIWQGKIQLEPLSGGLTNVNYLVSDTAQKVVVRLGDDIVEHQVMRFNELAASRAAHQAGLSPAVIYSEPGILVLEYITAKTLSEQDLRDDKLLERVVPLIQSCHHDMPKYLRGPALAFWPFQILRDYSWTLHETDSTYIPMLAELESKAQKLEHACGQIDLVFGHNDLLAANFLDDGNRLWLLDWDYAGFNSPLFDLGGLASNNGLSLTQEKWLLETYFEKSMSDEVWSKYQAMKCISLLRETMWSMVSEHYSKLEFDYSAYTSENLQRFNTAYDAIRLEEI